MKRVVVVILLIFMSVNLYCRQANIVHSISNIEHREIKVAMLLPLFYENLDELAFDEYNIDERRGRNYKCFSYISFYEGARIALDDLEKKGYKVSLYVFDVGENDAKKMQQALNYPQMQDMDLIVPLVFKQSFDIVNNFAKINRIPIINPMSQSEDILQNPYVFRIQPSLVSTYSSLVKYIKSKYSDSKVIVVYDDRYVSAPELAYFKETLPVTFEKWTLINYRKNAVKLKNYIDKSCNNFVVNLTYKNNKTEDRQYYQDLIKMLSKSGCRITLFSQYDWIDYAGNDIKQLQNMDFHFARPYYNDYTNDNFVKFVKKYRKHFNTEPNNIYASLGFDIMMYFIPFLSSCDNVLSCKEISAEMKDMIHRYKFVRENDNNGSQNTNAVIYKTENYKIKSCWSL